MAMDTQLERRQTARDPDADVIEGRRCPPVIVWSVLGAGALLFIAYVLITWIADGPRATPIGPTPVPGFMKVSIRVYEVVGLVGFAAFMYYMVVRPWRRAGHITLDGLFCLACLGMYFQDPLYDYHVNWALYNSYAVNLGSWTTHVPGWMAPAPNGPMAEPWLWVWPAYAYVVFGCVKLSCWLMSRFKARWPRLSNAELVLICLGFTTPFYFVCEMLWMRMGFYSYISTIPAMTLFKGHYYQYPVYEVLPFAITLMTLATIRYFVNDKGQTIVERGVDELRVKPRTQTALRFLALVAVTQFVYLATTMIPIQWFAIRSDSVPQDVTKRSYLTNQLCGPQTTYRCNSLDDPLPRYGSSHVNEKGELVPASK